MNFSKRNSFIEKRFTQADTIRFTVVHGQAADFDI